MAWTVNHIWVSEKPIITNQPIFHYKYVLLENGMAKKWESGVDRVADLRLLPEISYPIYSENLAKQIELYDEWESYKINFSINLP